MPPVRQISPVPLPETDNTVTVVGLEKQRVDQSTIFGAKIQFLNATIKSVFVVEGNLMDLNLSSWME